jgi:hypothetical protein
MSGFIRVTLVWASKVAVLTAVSLGGLCGCQDTPKPTGDPAASAKPAPPPPPPIPSVPASAEPALAAPVDAALPEAVADGAPAAVTPKADAGGSSAKDGAKDAGGAATATVDAGGAPSACGKPGQPPCPLFAWMKANAGPAMAAKDFGDLGKSLHQMIAFAPPGYTNWVSIAKDGEAAALKQNMDGVKASCRTCHEQYKQKYKNELRARPLP